MEKILEGRVSVDQKEKKTIYTVSYVYCGKGLTTDGSQAFFVEMLEREALAFSSHFLGGVQLLCNRV